MHVLNKYIIPCPFLSVTAFSRTNTVYVQSGDGTTSSTSYLAPEIHVILPTFAPVKVSAWGCARVCGVCCVCVHVYVCVCESVCV